jgi:hypothetical protein
MCDVWCVVHASSWSLDAAGCARCRPRISPPPGRRDTTRREVPTCRWVHVGVLHARGQARGRVVVLSIPVAGRAACG